MSCNVVAALLIAEIKKGNIMTELEYEISKILEQEQPITQSEPQDLAHIICELPKIKAIQQEPRVIKKNVDVLEWHKRRFPGADKWDVYRKLLEEVGELAEAIARGSFDNIELEFGDVEICLTVLADKLRVVRNEELIKKTHSKNLDKSLVKE